MKKLITLLLVLTGCVCTVSAAKLYVNVDNLTFWNGHVRIAAWGGTSDAVTDFTSEDAITVFGKSWFVYEMTNSNTTAQVRYWYTDNEETKQGNAFSKTISVSSDVYVVILNEQDNGDNNNYKYNSYSTPTFRDNGTTGWSTTSANMTVVNNNKLTHELTKSYVDAIGGDDIWFRIFNFGNQLYPNEDGLHISIAGNTSSYYNNADATSWSFGITKPTYEYEKIVVTAEYNTDTSTWTISADAYVTKTVSGTNKYATLGCSVPLQITESNSVTAYPLTAKESTGKITKGDAITTIPGGEGALLENATGSDKTIRAKVLASADASASNHLHAFTGGSGRLTQPGDGNIYYILSIKDEHVGFYKVNETSGNAMGANTAYLSVDGTLAREFFALDDEEVTNIEAAKKAKMMNGEYYNLAGQRVAQPTKGLYIVNGKKVIMK